MANTDVVTEIIQNIPLCNTIDVVVDVCPVNIIQSLEQVQSDWEETNHNSPAYIKNKPDLSQYATTQDLDDKQDTLQSGVNIKTINHQSLLGSGNIDIQGGGGSSEDTDTLAEASIRQVQELEQGMAQLQADVDKSITDLETTVDNKLEEASEEAEDADLVTAEALNDLKANTQEKLVSGTNIKTINNQSLLGSGDITIGGSVQSDWTEADTTSPAYIQNKPNMSDYATTASLASVATSGNYNDLTNKPTIPAAQVSSDWNSNSGVSQILNKPNMSDYATTASLASVATSGDYADLINTPTIPAAPVQSDWNESDSTSLAYIQNKPNISSSGFVQLVNGNKTGLVSSLATVYNSNIGNHAVIEGDGYGTEKIKASGYLSHAEGYATEANSDYSHAEGYKTQANGTVAHAEGFSTRAVAYAHAEGRESMAVGQYSHAEGVGTYAYNSSEHASGQYNVSTQTIATFGDAGNTLFSVGNGSNSSNRHNAFEIRQNGDIYLNDGSHPVSSTTNGVKIEVVNALPATPDANTLYIVV